MVAAAGDGTDESLADPAGSALAAALVAATVADVRSVFPDLSPAQLGDRIRATADRPAAEIPDPALGYGVVNPVTALTAPLDRNASPAVAGAVTVAPAPEPADNNWAIAVAATLLVLAAIAAGCHRRGRRRLGTAGNSTELATGGPRHRGKRVPDRGGNQPPAGPDDCEFTGESAATIRR